MKAHQAYMIHKTQVPLVFSANIPFLSVIRLLLSPVPPTGASFLLFPQIHSESPLVLHRVILFFLSVKVLTKAAALPSRKM